MPLDALTSTGSVYASLTYARTLAHVGDPLFVQAWDTHVILRPVPGEAGRVDAIGPYPVCPIGPHADIAAGLAALRDAGAVSIVLVQDPLSGPPPTGRFALCVPFKTHHLLDRREGRIDFSRHHRFEVRKGNRFSIAQQISLRDPAWRAHWCHLYAELVVRHSIVGLQAFPAGAIDVLSALPEEQLVAFAAQDQDGAVLAMQLWLIDRGCAYSHLTATTVAGYAKGATYVLYAAAVEQLSGCHVFDLGGGAGAVDDPADGLAWFKSGFANRSVVAHLCGAVLDESTYARLAAGRPGNYFPAYRS